MSMNMGFEPIVGDRGVSHSYSKVREELELTIGRIERPTPAGRMIIEFEKPVRAKVINEIKDP